MVRDCGPIWIAPLQSPANAALAAESCDEVPLSALAMGGLAIAAIVAITTKKDLAGLAAPRVTLEKVRVLKYAPGAPRS